MSGDADPTYVEARRVLLDALDALKDQLAGVILVGAQAIYLHTGAGDLAAAPYTSDADLALNPKRLRDDPRLEQLMRAAGFVPAGGDMIGTWIGSHDVPVDLLVPEALAGRGSRAARLGVHGDRVARRGRGLEAALIDNSQIAIAALDPSDPRRVEITVAGPAALLVAKLHKVWERRGGRRQEDKDALDVYRLLQAIPTDVLATNMRRLQDDALSRDVTVEAIHHVQILFAEPDAPGSQMAARAVELLDDPALVAASTAALAQDLLHLCS